MMGISVEFQRRLKELVNELENVNKTAAAQKIGISYMTFSKAYNYGIIPRTKILIHIADFFRVSLDYLLGRTDYEKVTEKSF